MYKPQPVDTDDVILSEDLLALTEQIASNVHDVWAVGRISEGWTLGEIKESGEEDNSVACAIRRTA